MTTKRNRPRGGGIPANNNVPRPTEIGTEVQSCPDCNGTAGKRFTHQHGCPVGAALDAMRATDLAWFAAHPGTHEYWRPLMPGDLGLSSLACVSGTVDGREPRVRVRAITDGIRMRFLPGDLIVRVVTPEGRSDLDGIRVASRIGTHLDGGYGVALDIDPTTGGDE